MATKIYLANDWLIKRTDMQDHAGTLLTGVAPRGLIALTPAATVGEHASLETVLTEDAPGTFSGVIQGTALTLRLLTLWNAANLVGQKLKVYERVIVDTEDYGDVEELAVERDRKVRRAS
jgi:hypothetical protein